MHKKLKLIFLVLIIVFLPAFGLKCQPKEVQKAMEPITLNYWRVWDGPDAFAEIIEKYSQIHPNITIKYRKLNYDEYEKELLEAWAEDRGPDIFSVHNTWLKKYQNKIEPLPDEITMAYPIVKGTVKKETITEMRTNKSLGLKKLKDEFVDAVYDDAVIKIKNEKSGAMEEKIFALPLSVDTLAMYYNKELLNNAGIIEPPAYWDKEFQQAVKKLTKQNAKGQIIQPGVALGGSANIDRYSDILSVLMMQNGAVMMDEYGAVTFNQVPPNLKSQGYNPGLEALLFYTDFANPAKEVYCWNKTLDNSLDMFSRGNLALMFGYSYHLPQINARASKLNFSVAKLPQIKGNSQIVNFANYWLETVSKKILTNPENLKKGADYAALKKDAAWDFIQFAAKAENVKSYLEKTRTPTALRSLVNEQLDDIDIGVFAEQVLTAKSWYRGADYNAAEKIIGEMIDGAVLGQDEIGNIIDTGAKKVQQTIN